MRASLWQAVTVAVCLVGPVRSARAQGVATTPPLSVTLEYDVPSTCPNEREFRSIVSQRLGRDPFVEAAANRVFVLVSPADERISGELVWRDNAGNSRGAQHFPSRTNHCAQVIQAMGFALAVQIQLLETEEVASPKPSNPEAASAAAAASASPSAPPAPAPPKAVTSAPDRPSVEQGAPPAVVRKPNSHGAAPIWAVGGGGAVALGMAAELVPEGRVFAGLRWPVAAVELGLEVSAPVTTRRADGAGFSQWYVLASAAGCGLVGRLSACAVLRAGSLRVSGRDIDIANSASTALVQSGLRLALSQHLNQSLLLSLHSEGLVNLTRWSTTLDGFPVWSAPRFALDSGLDLVVLFR
jgi:hypothetical protein